MSRKWEKEAGCVAASFVTARPPAPLGDRVPFVPTTKLLHAKIVRLGGAGSGPVASDYNPLFAGVMADGMVRSALGMREALRPSKSKGAGTTVVVNNYINTEGGLGGAGSPSLLLNAVGGGDADWMGRWANERYQQDMQRGEGNGNGGGGSPLLGRGWNGAPERR